MEILIQAGVKTLRDLIHIAEALDMTIIELVDRAERKRESLDH